MKKIEIYKFIGDIAPDIFENVYWRESVGGFYMHSGSITLDGSMCSFDGSDKFLKKLIADNITSRGSVEAEVSGFDERQNLYWDGVKDVPISEEDEFIWALDKFLSRHSYTREKSFTNLVKIGSVEDVGKAKLDQQQRKTA